ncbi:antibiotic biosynthesis monooxygenase [Caulobacter sp. 17J65-9]|uniref:putative quinol monooxygenase n=1 Tax=Caulobacter sp. 17J65-9 TaxID=2709382 RepID=UPI0013C6640F|nr:antibiotic biosynthesis monooxygenase [Caulobacter sp. 17J65-9]NEX91978.1 antibiotic biosynthesis monooxygenase [Caulobacter sp. 17J65-9]
MTTKALYARLEAKPGKEAAVEALLRDALALARAEPATTAWFAIRMGPTSFGVFDAFPDEEGRQAHLDGEIARILSERAGELFEHPPAIAEFDVLAAKLP